MKFLIVFALISLIATVHSAEKKNCPALAKEGEDGLRKMFLTEEGAKVPSNLEEFRNRCNEGKKLYKNMLEYKECLAVFPGQIFGETTRSIGNLIQKNCKDENGQTRALQLLQCADKSGKMKEAQSCAIGSLDVIDQLSQLNEPRDTLLPKICCLAHVTHECANNKLKGIQCTVDSANGKEEVEVSKHFSEIMDSLSKDAMELACADYKDIKTCKGKIPNEMDKMRATVNSGVNKIGDRKLIQPLLTIAEKIAV